MAIPCVPVLMYAQYIALRYSKITIFATASRFSIQTLEHVSQKGAAVLR